MANLTAEQCPKCGATIDHWMGCRACGYELDSKASPSSKDVSVSLRVQDDPELFVFGSPEATKVVQDALWGRGLTDGRIAVANLPSNRETLSKLHVDLVCHAAGLHANVTNMAFSPSCDYYKKLANLMSQAAQTIWDLGLQGETQADPTKWPMPPPPATWMPQWLREFHCQCEPAGDGAGQCVACQAADLIASSAQNGPAPHVCVCPPHLDPLGCNDRKCPRAIAARCDVDGNPCDATERCETCPQDTRPVANNKGE
jgi:hypothetical protein